MKLLLLEKSLLVKATGIGFVLIVGLMIGCKSDGVNTNTTSSTGPIFSQVSAASSGIDFVNEIIESPERSMGNYENFFSGGGVAIGDINNDGFLDVNGKPLPVIDFILIKEECSLKTLLQRQDFYQINGLVDALW